MATKKKQPTLPLESEPTKETESEACLLAFAPASVSAPLH